MPSESTGPVEPSKPSEPSESSTPSQASAAVKPPAPAAPPGPHIPPRVVLATEYAVIVFAGTIYALALKYFVFPSRVILTGTEGIAASLGYYFESEALFLLLYGSFQAVLITFAFLKISRTFALRSLLTVAMVLVLLPILPPLQFADPDSSNERIILVIFGGILAGLAKAIALRVRGSTGDEDILAAFFAMKYLKPVGAIAVIAAVVSTAFGLMLELVKTGEFERVVNTLMYTSIYIFTSAETLNNFFRKFKLVLVTTLTKTPDRIAEAIRSVAPHRTFTMQEGRGGYSKQEFMELRTVVTHEELAEVIDAIRLHDPKCFYFFHDIDGISGHYYIRPIG